MIDLAIEAIGLRKSFGSQPTLTDLDMQAPRGSLLNRALRSVPDMENFNRLVLDGENRDVG